jgi:hypothetical protein
VIHTLTDDVTMCTNCPLLGRSSTGATKITCCREGMMFDIIPRPIILDPLPPPLITPIPAPRNRHERRALTRKK